MRHDAMPRVIAGPPASTPSSRSISLAVRHGQLYLVRGHNHSEVSCALMVAGLYHNLRCIRIRRR